MRGEAVPEPRVKAVKVCTPWEGAWAQLVV